MKLYALPENVLKNVVDTLQELPYRMVSQVLFDITKARLVVDENQKPVELPTDVASTVTQDATVPTTDLNSLPL
jgi:ATP-dependent Lon protease